jgi:hypothetical protein
MSTSTLLDKLHIRAVSATGLEYTIDEKVATYRRDVEQNTTPETTANPKSHQRFKIEIQLQSHLEGVKRKVEGSYKCRGSASASSAVCPL